MSEYVLCFKPALDLYGGHDPSAALFVDGTLRFAAEEERFTRQKHAVNTFPERAIEACLNHCDLSLSEVDRIVLPYRPQLGSKILISELSRRASASKTIPERLRWIERYIEQRIQAHLLPTAKVESRLRAIDEPLPQIDLKPHHACHAASAFHPSGFDDAIVLTIDGKGEYDATVVWRGMPTGLERIKTYEFPNSLGHFFGAITEYLGYRSFNGEGKIMGLAPYGNRNREIEQALRSVVETGVDYDVTPLVRNGIEDGVEHLEELFGRPRNESRGDFDDWQKDLAFVAQQMLEETVSDIVSKYVGRTGFGQVALAGGVALNCKMNKKIRELEQVDEVFVQPVAHDAGLAVGAGMLGQAPTDVARMRDVYYGPSYDIEYVISLLERNKIDYRVPENLFEYVAEQLADGRLVGWFQGRLELGPRALGNRSILADPRTAASRDRVNRFVKHREEWRPFAPSILAEVADQYLKSAVESPFMIDTFSVKPERQAELEAVIHPADGTTRPQTVQEEQNPRYYRLISAFKQVTGVPVVLNTSFNDHGEPIVTTPTEALKDFYGMGLDTLVLDDVVVEK